MAKLNIHHKLSKAFALVQALKSDDFRVPLERHGLTAPEIERGRALVSRARALTAIEIPKVRRTAVLQRILSWDRRWTPVVAASLRFSHEPVYLRLFAGLQRGSGPKMVYFADLFASRLNELSASADPEDRQAWEKLVQRGLTPEILEEQSRLLGEAATISATGVAVVTVGEPTEREAAVEEAYRFYLEWSAIARTLFKNRTMLRMMGVGSGRGAVVDEGAAPVAEPEEPEEGGAPGPVITPPSDPVVAPIP